MSKLARINFNAPREVHEAFRTALHSRMDISQTQFLSRCMRAYALGELWFDGLRPVTLQTPDVADKYVPKPVEITQLGPPAMTNAQYWAFVNVWRMNGYTQDMATEVDRMQDWAAKEYGCSKASVADLMSRYNPDQDYSARATVDAKFGGV